MLLCTSPAQAVTLTATERGALEPNVHFGTGGSETTAGNYVTGWSSDIFATSERNNSFNFDLSGVVGNVPSATFTLNNNSGAICSPDPTEILGVFNVTTSTPDLISNNVDAAAFVDLGSGISLGTVTLDMSNQGIWYHAKKPVGILILVQDDS